MQNRGALSRAPFEKALDVRGCTYGLGGPAVANWFSSMTKVCDCRRHKRKTSDVIVAIQQV